MHSLTMRIEIPAGDAPELEFPRDGQARHAVVPEFGFREQDGAWNQ
jgi:hypothetical protein